MLGRIKAISHAINHEAAVMGVGNHHDREIAIACRAERLMEMIW